MMVISETLPFERTIFNFSRSANERLFFVSLCASLAILQSALFDGGASLLIAAAAVAGALVSELCIHLRRGGISFIDGSSVATALLLTLFLPNNIAPGFAAAGAAFGVLVIKYCFGGLGANWFNPALGGLLFMKISWPDAFKRAMEPSALKVISEWMPDGSTGLMAALSKNGAFSGAGAQTSGFPGKNFFSFFDLPLPEWYVDFFLNPGPGLIADRGLAALVLGGVIIALMSVSRCYISLIYAAVLFVISGAAGFLPVYGRFAGLDSVYCLFCGGVFAGALFFVVEPVTSAKTVLGNIACACAAALFTYFFRFVMSETYGAVFAIALVNLFLPLVRVVEERLYYERTWSLGGSYE